jgi:hypothetical protein
VDGAEKNAVARKNAAEARIADGAKSAAAVKTAVVAKCVRGPKNGHAAKNGPAVKSGPAEKSGLVEKSGRAARTAAGVRIRKGVGRVAGGAARTRRPTLLPPMKRFPLRPKGRMTLVVAWTRKNVPVPVVRHAGTNRDRDPGVRPPPASGLRGRPLIASAGPKGMRTVLNRLLS